jgi:alkylation response protein AidB-like acyl-CoA dehydrogenase
MNLELTNEQKELRRVVDEFGRKEIAPVIAQLDEEEKFPLEIVQKAAKLGWMGGAVPEEYGGAGLDYMTNTIILETISKYDHITGVTLSAPSGLVGGAILQYGTPEQKEKYLVPFCKGEKFGAAGVTEPHSGTDVASMETTYKKDGDYFIINGSKMWISFLEVADWILTFATYDRSLKKDGITAFIIDKNTPGLTFKPVKNKMGYRPLASGAVYLEDVRVHKSQMVGQEGEGFKIAMCSVENGRLSVAARALGIAQACYEEAVEYAKQRIVFDRPISKYQLVQSKITDMVTGIESARYFVYNLAHKKDKGEDARREASIAKMYASDILMRTATEAFQIFGAYGVSPEYNIGRYFRDAKIFQIVEGTNDVHRLIIAGYSLGHR